MGYDDYRLTSQGGKVDPKEAIKFIDSIKSQYENTKQIPEVENFTQDLEKLKKLILILSGLYDNYEQ